MKRSGIERALRGSEGLRSEIEQASVFGGGKGNAGNTDTIL